MQIMKIGDLEANKRICVEVIARAGKKEYQVITRFSEGGVVFIDAIRFKNQVINFMQPGIILNVIYAREGEKPIVWRDCLMKVVEFKGKQYHAIICKKVGVEVNRRTSVRIFVGDPGSAMIGEHRSAMSITVKDISSTGFSFLSTKKVDAKPGDHVRISFDVKSHHLHFELEGKVVRTKEEEDGRSFYGCKMETDYRALDEYIAQRQREQARHVQKQLLERAKETFYKK